LKKFPRGETPGPLIIREGREGMDGKERESGKGKQIKDSCH